MDHTEGESTDYLFQILLGSKDASTNHCKVNWFVKRKCS
jgi:hypothetical protein